MLHKILQTQQPKVLKNSMFANSALSSLLANILIQRSLQHKAHH